MITKEQLWWKHSDQEAAIDEFVKFMSDRPNLAFYFPNYEKAPWHVQVKLETDAGCPVYVQFWPHKHKAMCEGRNPTFSFEQSLVEGWEIVNNELSVIDPDDEF